MKLNLLPTSVSKAGAARTTLLLSAILAAAMVGASVWMISSSKSELDGLKARAAELRPQVAAAVAVSKEADEIIQKAGGIILNQKLSESMMAHNTTYPDLYDEVRKYIPTYFRVTSMSAVPASDQLCTLNLTGVVQTYQQYADLMLALLRIPGATSIQRQGFQPNDYFVPNLSDGDQTGRPIRVGEEPIPDDPEARLQYFQARGTVEGFVGGFGTPEIPRNRGAMPNWSQVAITIALAKNIQTPDPRASLAGAAAAGGGVPASTTPGNPAPSTPAPGPGRPGRGDDDI